MARIGTGAALIRHMTGFTLSQSNGKHAGSHPHDDGLQ
jgi:hypothetical protein